MEFYEYTVVCCVYLYTSLMWGLFAAQMNTKVHPNATLPKNLFCFVINFIGMPVAMTVAVLMLYGGKHDKYFTKS